MKMRAAKYSDLTFIILLSLITSALGYVVGYCNALGNEDLTYSPPTDVSYAAEEPSSQPV